MRNARVHANIFFKIGVRAETRCERGFLPYLFSKYLFGGLRVVYFFIFFRRFAGIWLKKVEVRLKLCRSNRDSAK